MALRRSVAFRKKIVDGGSAAGVAGPWGTTGRLLTYSGAQPTTADTAPTGTLLCTNSMNGTAAFGASNTPAAASTADVTTTAAAVSSATVAASGTAGYVRQQLSADAGTTNNTDVRMDYLVATDITFDNAALVSGGTVNFTSIVLGEPYQ